VAETGARGATAAPQNVSLDAPSAAGAIDPATVAAIEARLRALESAARTGVRAAATPSARASDAEVLRVVHDLMTQSESRQQTELARRIAQVIYDMDQKRAGDLALIRDRFARIDANVTEEAEARRDMANVLLASARQK
jgi:hypothetical protein